MAGSSHSDVMVAGAVAAFTVDLLVYPLDTLKTRQQSQDFVRTFADADGPRRRHHHRRLSPQLFRGLYQGIGIVIVATLPAAGTFFTTYEAAKTFLGRHAAPLGLPQPLVHSAASAVAEMASCFVLTPAEVIKQNAQMVQSGGSGGGPHAAVSASASLQALRQLAGPRWARNLMSGYTAMVARNLPFTALQFPIFEYVRETVWARRAAAARSDGAERSLLETGLVTGTSAGLAGSFAAVVTTPMDVVKTRMMLMAGKGQDARDGAHDRTESQRATTTTTMAARGKKPGGLAIARQVYREQGMPGLFRGAVLRGGWTAMGSGLYLGMYEMARVWLTKNREAAGERSL